MLLVFRGTSNNNRFNIKTFFTIINNFRRVTRLSVTLAESPEQIFRQNPAYDSTQFVSDIGGSAGLILGISGKYHRSITYRNSYAIMKSKIVLMFSCYAVRCY